MEQNDFPARMLRDVYDAIGIKITPLTKRSRHPEKRLRERHRTEFIRIYCSTYAQSAGFPRSSETIRQKPNRMYSYFEREIKPTLMCAFAFMYSFSIRDIVEDNDTTNKTQRKHCGSLSVPEAPDPAFQSLRSSTHTHMHLITGGEHFPKSHPIPE